MQLLHVFNGSENVWLDPDGDGAYIGLDMDSALCRPLRCCDKKQRDDGADCSRGWRSVALYLSG